MRQKIFWFLKILYSRKHKINLLISLEAKIEEMFGPHLTLDLYSCNKNKISDVDFILEILDELPELIGMHKISSPQVVKYSGNPNTFDSGGISAFVLIAESHISIHTFIEQQFVSIDIFSCKNFDVAIAESYFIEKFGPQKVEKHLINRGVEFPKDVMEAKEVVGKMRENLPKPSLTFSQSQSRAEAQSSP